MTRRKTASVSLTNLGVIVHDKLPGPYSVHSKVVTILHVVPLHASLQYHRGVLFIQVKECLAVGDVGVDLFVVALS